MPIDENTYWRGTFTARQKGDLPKVTKVYAIAIPKKDVNAVEKIAGEELSGIFHRHSGQVVTKPLGGFVQITHPERRHDLVSKAGYPVWIEGRARY